MARGKRDGLLIAGGGLAGSLAALAMARARPEVPILLVEEGERFGGEHVLFFLDREVDEAARPLTAALVSRQWPGYYLALAGLSRNLKTGCSAILPDDIDRAVREALRPDQYRLGTRIVAARDNELILQGGEKIRADGAIDARGAANLSMLELGWEKSLARRYRFEGAHGLDRPVLIDATGDGRAGAGYMRCIPLTEDRMVVEDVHLSEVAGIDAEEAGRRMEAYVARRGWVPAEREREAVSAHPLAIGGDFGAFWRVGGARVAKLGLRGGFFHPATGHSLADALRTAALLTEQRDFSGVALHDLFAQQAAGLWRKRDYYRGFNKALFESPPADRMRRVEHFYSLDPGVIGRFRAGEATLFDKRRIMRG